MSQLLAWSPSMPLVKRIEAATLHPLSAVSKGSAPIQPVAHPASGIGHGWTCWEMFHYYPTTIELINSLLGMVYISHANGDDVNDMHRFAHFHQPITNWDCLRGNPQEPVFFPYQVWIGPIKFPAHRVKSKKIRRITLIYPHNSYDNGLSSPLEVKSWW